MISFQLNFSSSPRKFSRYGDFSSTCVYRTSYPCILEEFTITFLNFECLQIISTFELLIASFKASHQLGDTYIGNMEQQRLMHPIKAWPDVRNEWLQCMATELLTAELLKAKHLIIGRRGKSRLQSPHRVVMFQKSCPTIAFCKSILVLLQVYVRSRVLALAGCASVSRRLGLGSEVIWQAFADTLTEGINLSSISEEAESGGAPLQLSFGHECQ